MSLLISLATKLIRYNSKNGILIKGVATINTPNLNRTLLKCNYNKTTNNNTIHTETTNIELENEAKHTQSLEGYKT